MAQDLQLALRIRADVQQALREIRGLREDVGRLGGHAEQGARGMERLGRAASGTTSVLRQLRGVLASVGAALVVRRIIQADDAYTRLQGRLRLVTETEQERIEVERQLFELAQQTRTAYESTVELYTRVAQSSERLGLSQQQLLEITRSTNQAIAISGASAVEAQAGVIQFAQALASGELRGDELRSVLEQLPRLARAIGDGLVQIGVAAEGGIGEIRRLAADGLLTAETVVSALLTQGERIEEEYSRLPRTVGQAWTQLANDLQRAAAAGDMQPLVESIDDLRELVTDPAFVEGVAALVDMMGRIAVAATRAAVAIRDGARRLGEWVAETIHGPADPIARVTRQMDELRRQRDEILRDLQRPRLLRGAEAFASEEELRQRLQRITEQLIELEQLRQNLINMAARQTDTAATTTDTGGTPAPIAPVPLAVDDEAIDAARDQLQQLAASLREQVATWGQGAAAALEYRLTIGDLADAVAALGPEGERLREEILAQARALEALREEQRAAAEAEREHQRLMDEGARLTESLRTAQERYDAELARYRELLEAGAISQETFNRAVQAAQMRLEAASQTTKSAGEEMSQYAVGAARSIQSTFADFLFDPFDEGLAGMVRGFADAIRRMIAEAAAARTLGWLLGPQFGVTGELGGVLGSLFHSGGIVGEAASTRTLPALAWLGAPRYHSGGIAGLAPDEVPAILRRGEEVLTADDPRHRANGGGQGVGVRIINVIDPGVTHDHLQTPAGERVILNIIGRNARAVRAALQG